MKRVNIGLYALLGIQIVLAVVLWSSQGGSPAPLQPTMLAAANGDIQSIQITAKGEDGSLKIAHGKHGWSLPGSDGFPADEAHVSAVVSALRNIGAQFPVAVTADAQQRLQVSEDQFRRRLQFAGADGALATVYLGKAAGAGEVYARSADSDAIYQLALPLGRVSKQASDWYAMQTAALPESSLKKVVLPGFTLVRGKAGDWGLADKESAQQSLDAAAVAALLRRLTAPEFQSVTKGDAPQGKAAFSYQLVTKKGDAVQFQLFDADQDQPATLVRSDQPWRYQLQPEQLASLEKTSLDGLVAKTQPAGSSQQPQTPTARADEQGAPRPPPSKTAGKPKKAGNTG